MKRVNLKHIFSAALIVATMWGGTSCINDLNISSIDPQSSPSFDQNAAFVKQYALLGLTGQKGLPAHLTLTDRMKVNRAFTVRYSTARNWLPTNVYGYGRTTWISHSSPAFPGTLPVKEPNGYMSAWDITSLR